MSTKTINPKFAELHIAPADIYVTNGVINPRILHRDSYIDRCVNTVLANTMMNTVRDSQAPTFSPIPTRTANEIINEMESLQIELDKAKLYEDYAEGNPDLYRKYQIYKSTCNKLDFCENPEEKARLIATLREIELSIELSYSLPKRFAIALDDKYHQECAQYASMEHISFGFDFATGFSKEKKHILHNWSQPAHQWWLRRAETLLEPFSEILDKVEPTLICNALVSSLDMHSNVPEYLYRMPIKKKRRQKRNNGSIN